MVTGIKVPFNDKAELKLLKVAKWCSEKKTWYIVGKRIGHLTVSAACFLDAEIYRALIKTWDFASFLIKAVFRQDPPSFCS